MKVYNFGPPPGAIQRRSPLDRVRADPNRGPSQLRFRPDDPLFVRVAEIVANDRLAERVAEILYERQLRSRVAEILAGGP